MNTNLPLFDVPKYYNGVAGGAFAVPLATRNVQRLDYQDLPNPPAQANNAPGRRPG